MATDTQIEAQRLVSISLSKMAQSRSQRTGISLHKSLLVATVLQKARFLCMEEVFRMVHSSPVYNVSSQQSHLADQCYPYDEDDDDDDDDEEEDTLIGLTPEEAGLGISDHSNNDGNIGTSIPSYPSEQTLESITCSQTCARHENNSYVYNNNNNNNNNSAECDKENLAPSPAPSFEAPTYFDLDKNSREQCFRDRCSSITSYSRSLKRRRAVCETEIEEAVQSILPKKTRIVGFDSDADDSVFLEEATLFNDNDSSEEEEENNETKAMDIDRITSLVSIFSFGAISSTSNSMTDLSVTSVTGANSSCPSSFGNLTRSSSTPDLCSAQAKETDSLQQTTYIAMTV